MPAGLVALLPALSGAGTAGTEMGLQASGALTPTTPGTPGDTAAAQAALAQKMQPQQQQISPALAPALQENVGGAVSQGQLQQILAELTGGSGTMGDMGTAQQTVFGTSPQGLASG